MDKKPDLIDRNELYNQIRLYLNRHSLGETTLWTTLTTGEIASIIADMPAVNATEVVHCWECAHRRKRECPLYSEKYMEYDMGYGDIEQVCRITDGTIDNGFCHKGERRSD